MQNPKYQITVSFHGDYMKILMSAKKLKGFPYSLEVQFDNQEGDIAPIRVSLILDEEPLWDEPEFWKSRVFPMFYEVLASYPRWSKNPRSYLHMWKWNSIDWGISYHSPNEPRETIDPLRYFTTQRIKKACANATFKEMRSVRAVVERELSAVVVELWMKMAFSFQTINWKHIPTSLMQTAK